MPLKMKYFMLKPKSKSAGDPFAAASRKAMRVYATMIRQVDVELSIALQEWANRETEQDISLYGKDE